MAFLGEAWGYFAGWRPVLSVRDPTDKKRVWPSLSVTQFLGIFWRIRTTFALRIFLTLRMLGGFTRVFREICYLLVFGGVWALGEILRPPGAQNGPKIPKSGFPRSSGPFWPKRPPTKFDRMLNADPVNPLWGPMCPWGPGYGRFGGRWGPFRWLGTGFVGYGPN